MSRVEELEHKLLLDGVTEQVDYYDLAKNQLGFVADWLRVTNRSLAEWVDNQGLERIIMARQTSVFWDKRKTMHLQSGRMLTEQPILMASLTKLATRQGTFPGWRGRIYDTGHTPYLFTGKQQGKINAIRLERNGEGGGWTQSQMTALYMLYAYTL